MKKYFIKLARFILNFVPLYNIIIFESKPDFSCNTFPVYQYMISNEWDRKFKFIWLVSDKDIINPIENKNTYVINEQNKNIFNQILIFFIRSVAKCNISSNRVLRKMNDKQISIFLSHGSKIKKTRGMYEVGNGVDYVLCQSHFFDDIITYEYNISHDKLVYLGFPRNDYFYKDSSHLKMINQIDKFIVWLPTFRKHKNGLVNSKIYDNSLGIPIIYSIETLEQFNSFLKINDIHILFKPHPAQDVTMLKISNLSNFIVIDDKYLAENEVQLYELIAQSLALITDYSSVFYDYLLLNTPIATTTDDLTEYADNRGFAFDINSMYEEATTQVSNYESLIDFILCVLNGCDEKKEARKKICDLTNIHQDGSSTERVVMMISRELNRL